MIMQNYFSLAEALISHNSPSAHQELVSAIADISQVKQIFKNAHTSHNLLFVSSEIFAKRILNQQFINVDDQSQSEPNNELMTKKNIMENVSQTLWNIVCTQSLPPHILRSCLNTIAVCMRCAGQISKNEANFVEYFTMITPSFAANQDFVKSNGQSLCLIFPDQDHIPQSYPNSVTVLRNLLDYSINSAYYSTYYLFRRNMYNFRNTLLPYIFNFSIHYIKILFRKYAQTTQKQEMWSIMSPSIKLLQSIVMFPYTLGTHETELEDEIHDNISGLQTEIYFPSYFRNFLCDTDLINNIVAYFNSLMSHTLHFNIVKEDVILLIRVIGRCLCTTEYVFCGEEERRDFRRVSIEFAMNILMDHKNSDSYYLLCLTRINIKILAVYTERDYGVNKEVYLQALMSLVRHMIVNGQGKIEDGHKNPIRLSFELMCAIIENSTNSIQEEEVNSCAQEILDLLFVRLTLNDENERMMLDFGLHNSQEVECFSQIFAKVPEIFKINTEKNLSTLKGLDLSALNQHSVSFWLHLCALLLPQHDTSLTQTELILKFFHVAVQARSISSLHYMQTLVTQILAEVEDGISATYLWKFMEDQLKMSFEDFLTQIIKYTLNILTIPNYTLIQNGLQLFKALFTKLCKYRHRSFSRYFKLVEEVSKKIDSTMLVQVDYFKLRMSYFSVISMIWVTESKLNFVYKIIANICNTLSNNNDFIHFMRYLIDFTGILQPVQSSQVFKVLVELILHDMDTLLPLYLGTPQQLQATYQNQTFVRTFVKFLLQLVNDFSYRLSYDTQTNLGFRIEETFRPYILAVPSYEYPKKTLQVWMKYVKLNPLAQLLPLHRSFKEKNSPHYKNLLREYFENLHRLKSDEEFYYLYSLIEDNVELMSDWWQEIINRELKPTVNVGIVVSARIWNSSRQKETFAKMLYRIGRYDSAYLQMDPAITSEAKYVKWFNENYS